MSRDCCRPDYDALFDDGAARRKLAAYRRNGAQGTTRTLLDAIIAEGVVGASVLDIGGGVGVIGAELLDAGASSVISVDASGPYLAAARQEIQRRGLGERATFHHRDFVEMAADVPDADVVTLDRVVCCYLDWEALVGRSVERARRLYGLVYPRDRWWMRWSSGLVRAVGGVFGRARPFSIHSDRRIDTLIRGAGFVPVLAHRGLAWQTVLYRRET